MTSSDIAAWLKAEIEPLPDHIYGNRYRASAYLVDGTHLPCVVFQSRCRQVELAIRRFEETRKDSAQHRQVVNVFATAGSRVNDYELSRVDKSPFAWPVRILKEIHGETTMGWTSFVAEMNDGARFTFGTTFHFEFFDLPRGYTYDQIKTISSGVVYSEEKGVRPFSLAEFKTIACIRERPFFTCYLTDLDA